MTAAAVLAAIAVGIAGALAVMRQVEEGVDRAQVDAFVHGVRDELDAARDATT